MTVASVRVAQMRIMATSPGPWSPHFVNNGRVSRTSCKTFQGLRLTRHVIVWEIGVGSFKQTSLTKEDDRVRWPEKREPMVFFRAAAVFHVGGIFLCR